jgi:Fe2+ transport system protein FeoA
MMKPIPTVDNTEVDGRHWITCPMCGFEFDRTDTRCEHGCPLGAFCNLVSCPNCDYEFPDRPQRTSWLWRLLRRKDPDPLFPEGVQSAASLAPGESAEVVCLGSSRSPRYSALAVYGLVAGAEITLIQRRPSCVIRIDETELALDPEIAEEILVRTR